MCSPLVVMATIGRRRSDDDWNGMFSYENCGLGTSGWALKKKCGRMVARLERLFSLEWETAA